LGRCTRRPPAPWWWHQLVLPLSSVQVTFCFPVQPKGQARVSGTRLTYPLVCEAMTAHCRSVAHRVEVTAAPPAQVHERSHVVSRNSGCTACLHCISFDRLTFRDCLRSRSERSRPLSAFLLFPTGCMRGRCTGRIAWLHCMQVTLSVARGTALL
jgi:hypothetical protein